MTADVRRAIDERPPVLYLRSFRNDALPANDTSQGLSRYFDPYRERSNLEELIVSCCKGSGPVVAIGDPKTHVQPTGAARMWRHTSWHDMVIKLMSESAAIIVVMDITDNLRWEIETICRGPVLARTIFVFPPPRGADGAEHARSMIDILSNLHVIDDLDLSGLGNPEEIRVLTIRERRVQAFASRTGTYSDYDVGLQMALDTLTGNKSA